MIVRVMLGGCPLARRFARELVTWPGSLSVLVDDADAAERLREDGIAATDIDLTDPGTIRSAVPAPDVLIVVSDSPSVHRWRLEVGADAFPDARIIAVSEPDWPSARDLADQHICLDQLTAGELVNRLNSTTFERSMMLMRTLSTIDGPLAVVMHDNPDPDAIAAALGVTFLAEAVGTEAIPMYAGEITHQENRAFVNLLELELEVYDPPLDLDSYGSIALVDHAHPGVNDQLPPLTSVDIIIDHHPAREEADATFVDRRHIVGATSTLVAEHLLQTQLEPDVTLATALWYGIQVDTDGFRRGVSELDFETAARLRPWVDTDLLGQIEEPQVTARTLESIGAAIDNREVTDDVVIAGIGEIAERDALAQAADYLLRMEDISTVLIYGQMDSTVYASSRSRSDQIDVGEAIRLAFGQIGNAGGHDDMAGAQIPIGMLHPPGDEAATYAIADVIADRFLEGIDMASRPLPSGYIEQEAGLE